MVVIDYVRAFVYVCTNVVYDYSHVKQRIQNMEGDKLTKKSKNLKKSALNISENGKINKNSEGKKKAKLSVPANSDGNVNKKAAKLVAMLQGPGAAKHVNLVQKKPKSKELGTSKPQIKKDDSEVPLVAQPTEANIKKKKDHKKGNCEGVVLQVDVKPKIEAELSETDLKKIEKKKAKKAAQKLKKAQRKRVLNLEPKDGAKVAPPQPKKPKEKKKILKKATENGVSKDDKSVIKAEKAAADSETPVKDVSTPVSDRVLSKKERKTKKRLLLKEQRLAEKSTRSPAEEEATVFVGNVPVNTKRVQLIRLFQNYGPVNSIRLRSAGGKVLHKHKMRKAAGSLNAYVVLKSKTSAEKALELNGVEFKGNHLRVTKSAKNITSQTENDEAKRTIFVGNLKYSATEEALREIFTSCGEIEYIRCIRDGDKGCKGVAYVCFKHADCVGLALELKDTILEERPIHVERYSVTKLGAKEQRDAQAAKEATAKQHKAKKSPKIANKSNNKKDPNDGEESKKSKKSEFRGVKVHAIKKKNKTKKSKNSQASELAKRIAPKVKNENN